MLIPPGNFFCVPNHFIISHSFLGLSVPNISWEPSVQSVYRENENSRVLLPLHPRCQGRNCDFELKNGSGFCLQGLIAGRCPPEKPHPMGIRDSEPMESMKR